MDEHQQEHQEDLKAKFCVASEMIAKLFLGHNQSHYNGAVSITTKIREWCQSRDEISKDELLAYLNEIEPSPSSTAATKEQSSFKHSRKRLGNDTSRESATIKRHALVTDIKGLAIK
eukprot:TRINITY_DN10635_c0_g1_i1.p1 TRINITY_DN10635_c0_g1~~TRINITY_DN10635_c0_g1_i1.p1  ORF type:complete len:131 (+),score=26.00 TRINITY_DN10635_c0_g1_i1:44-394(+)